MDGDTLILSFYNTIEEYLNKNKELQATARSAVLNHKQFNGLTVLEKITPGDRPRTIYKAAFIHIDIVENAVTVYFDGGNANLERFVQLNDWANGLSITKWHGRQTMLDSTKKGQAAIVEKAEVWDISEEDIIDRICDWVENCTFKLFSQKSGSIA